MASNADLIIQAQTISAWIALAEEGLTERLIQEMKEAKENFQRDVKK
ncbi:MAG: hypothetical protein FWF50_06290 [Defluviitaleaceae bacterium]|nr:hypothetical protein [Defluviitaleaceae bacterium]